MDLRHCVPGTTITIVALRLPDDEVQRLADLGVRVGAQVHVMHCGAFGGRVIAVGTDRIAIDGATCRRIDVEQ